MEKHSLDTVMAPGSVAVIGASHDPLKWGNLTALHLVKSNYGGNVYLVNPKGGVIYGKETVRSMAEIAENIDLVVIGIPQKHVVRAVEEAVAKKARGIVIITAGFSETGEEGKSVEREILRIAQQGGTRIVGPNCLGFYNAAVDLNTTILPFEKGFYSLLTQSGNFGLEINYLAKKRGAGFSKFISVGNQADVMLHEYLDYIGKDPDTRVIMSYIEGVRDGKEFFRVAGEVTRVKPMVVLKIGTSAAGIRSAASHTGSLAGNNKVFNAVFKQVGIIRVQNSYELLDVSEALAKCPLPRGNRIAILADGGGHATIAADMAERHNLEVPVLSAETQQKLEAVMPPQASKKNPVDFAGGAEADLWSFVKCSEILLADDQIDGLLIAGQYGGYQDVFPEFKDLEEQISEGLAALVTRYNKPVICHTMYLVDQPRSLEILSEKGIPVYGIVETAMRSMSALVEYSGNLERFKQVSPEDAGLPQAGAEKVREMLNRARREQRPNLAETEAGEVLRAYGMPVVPSILARNEQEAVSAAGGFGYPVALKVVSPDILHKSDAGGVKLNLRSEAEVAEACREITGSARRYNDKADVWGLLVAPMINGGTEVIIGATVDEVFGHVVMFGLGGIFVELLEDVSFRVCPVSKNEALEMICEIKGYPVLQGARGYTPADLDAIADIIVKVSRLVSEHPEIEELDLNPVRISGRDAAILDARVILSKVTS